MTCMRSRTWWLLLVLASSFPFLLGIPMSWERLEEFRLRLIGIPFFQEWSWFVWPATVCLLAAFGSYRLVCLPVALAGTWVAVWRMPRWGWALAWLSLEPAVCMQSYMVGVLGWLRGGLTPHRIILSLLVLWLATGLLVFVGYAVGRMALLALRGSDSSSSSEVNP